MVSILECELELDPSEERRRRMEDEAVLAGVERPREVTDPALGVRFLGSQQVAAAIELDADTLSRHATLDIEDVGGE
jgi:hypothetical protein